MTYYMEVARPALQRAAEDLGGMAEQYETRVTGSCDQLGAISWPLLLAFCQGGYNSSLEIVRDAAADTAEGLSKCSDQLQQIKQAYERLEANNEVR